MTKEELEAAIADTEQQFNLTATELERLRGDYRTYKRLLAQITNDPTSEGEADAPDQGQ